MYENCDDSGVNAQIYSTNWPELLVQALISVQALVFDLAQLTCQKRFDCRNAILGSSAILLGTSCS